MGAARDLAELTPFVRRCAELDPDNPVRLRSVQAPGLVVTSAFAVLPFGALVERIIATPGHPLGDRTHRAAELLAWLDRATLRLVLAAFVRAARGRRDVAVYAFGGDPFRLAGWVAETDLIDELDDLDPAPGPVGLPMVVGL